jgi:MFS family permease
MVYFSVKMSVVLTGPTAGILFLEGFYKIEYELFMKLKNSPLAVIFLVVFIDLVGFGIIIPLGPYFATYVGATPLQVGILMSVFSLMQFLFNPFWGRMSDKYGRRPILLMSLLGASISYLIFAFSQTYIQLLIARGLAGFFGANISTAMAYVADITDKKDRSKSMGLIERDRF